MANSKNCNINLFKDFFCKNYFYFLFLFTGWNFCLLHNLKLSINKTVSNNLLSII